MNQSLRSDTQLYYLHIIGFQGDVFQISSLLLQKQHHYLVYLSIQITSYQICQIDRYPRTAMDQYKNGFRPPINITPRKQRNNRHPSLPQKLNVSDTKPNHHKSNIYDGSPKTPNHQQYLTLNQPINMKQSLIHYQRPNTNDQQLLRITNEYENKLQSMAEEYYLYRKSTDQKMKEITKQKFFWQNFVTKMNHHQQKWVQQRVNNKVAERIEEEKAKFNQQKEEWRKQISNVISENAKLKQSLIEVTHRPYCIPQPMLPDNCTPQPMLPDNSISQPILPDNSSQLFWYNPIHEQQMQIQQNQRMRGMIIRLEGIIQTISQQKVKKQLIRLNSKYNN